MSGRLLGRGLAGLVLAAMGVALPITAAGVIYQGPLEPFVGRGIALTLVGMVPAALIGLALTTRGAICQPQNPVAILLSVPAATIAAAMADPASERSFATVAALVAVTTAATGGVAWLLGRMRLGYVARFVPYPVLGGFLAATGYLLVMGALGMLLRTPVTLGRLEILLAPGAVARWLPWALAGIAIAEGARRLRSPMVLPVGLAAVAAGFYVAIALLGLGLAGARDGGLLLGPFPRGFLDELAGWRPLDIDWRAIAGQVPSIAAVIGLSVLSALLAGSTLEAATGSDGDPDRDLRTIGLANLAAAAGGGLGGFQSLAMSFLALATGIGAPAGSLLVAAAGLAALLFGAPLISALPVGLFAAGLVAIGGGMLLEALWAQRRARSAGDHAVVLAILLVTACFGFLAGVAAGLLAAALIFVLTVARIDVVRVATTGARMRSRIERPAAEQALLATLGQASAIYVLSGQLFFGSAHRLVERIGAVLAGATRPRFVLIDFKAVRGLDTSAARALVRLDAACRAAGAELVLSGLDARGAALVRGHGGATGGPRQVATLESALEEVEAALLVGHRPRRQEVAGLIDALRRRHPGVAVEAYFQQVRVPAGAEVIRQGDVSDSLLVLGSGALRIEVVPAEGPPLLVARCLPGALVGEIGLYAGLPRTARVVAEAPSSFLRIDAAALDRMAGEAPALLADFHRTVAATLARRLGRTTALLADAEVG